MNLLHLVALLTLAFVVGSSLPNVVSATSPTLPIQILKNGRAAVLSAARLQPEVSANPAEIAQVRVSSTVITGDRVVLSAGVPMRQLAAPTAAVTAQERVAGSALALSRLAPGYYVHVIDVEARWRQGGPSDKPLMLRDLEYFRVERDQVIPITIDEYTDALSIIDQVVQPDGSVRPEYRGVGVDEGIVRGPAGSIPVTEAIDAPRPPPSPAPTGRRPEAKGQVTP